MNEVSLNGAVASLKPFSKENEPVRADKCNMFKKGSDIESYNGKLLEFYGSETITTLKIFLQSDNENCFKLVKPVSFRDLERIRGMLHRALEGRHFVLKHYRISNAKKRSRKEKHLYYLELQRVTEKLENILERLPTKESERLLGFLNAGNTFTDLRLQTDRDKLEPMRMQGLINQCLPDLDVFFEPPSGEKSGFVILK